MPKACTGNKKRGWVGTHPAWALVGQGAAWHQSVHVEMGVERLIPGVQEHEATKLASQIALAKLHERLAGGPQQQGEQTTFVGEDAWVEVVRQGKDAVEIGHCKEFGFAVCDPRFLGEGLACGAVAIATRVVGIALEATLLALLSVSPECSCPTEQDVVHDLVVGWRDRVRRALGWAIEAQDVGDFPLWCAVVCPAC